MDTIHEYPAVFDKLDTSNPNDTSSVSAFSILRNAEPQLYYADGTLYTGSTYQPGLSPYQCDTIIGLKLAELAAYGYAVGTTKQDSINAMEDLICDEMALELSFEGCRWYDLKRIATHKNQAGLYGSNFGSLWLSRKLAYKNPAKDLADPNNWYLPFK